MNFHAHIYFSAEQAPPAAALRAEIDDTFPALQVGTFHTRPVGPHPKGMFQVAFTADQLTEFLPWLLRSRQGLTVLVHPETGDDLEDHTTHAMWIGAPLELNTAIFSGSDEGSDTKPLN